MEHIYHIAPAQVSRLWLFVPLTILVVTIGIVSVLLVGMIRGAKSSTFAVGAEGLRISGDVYGRLIPMNQIVRSEVGRVDLSGGPYKLSMRTAGSAVPGYNSGWYRLVNGHKALVYVTDRERVVRVPTTAGYDVLLSVLEPDDFVRDLRGDAVGSAKTLP